MGRNIHKREFHMCDGNDMNSILWENRGSIHNSAWADMERGGQMVRQRLCVG